MATSYRISDAELIQTKALTASANGTVYTTAFDLEAQSGKQAQVAQMELLIEAPALNTTQLPDAATMTYKVQCDNDSAFGSPKTLADSILVQTGAASAGAVAAEARYIPPTDVERYVRVAATGLNNANSAAATLTCSLKF